MSAASFIKRSELMEKVNRTFSRDFRPGVSRPKFRQLNLSRSSHCKLKSLFFDDDGSLSNAAKKDVDTSVRNDPRYITFANKLCVMERKDKRWQVPIRKHVPSECGYSMYALLENRIVLQ